MPPVAAALVKSFLYVSNSQLGYAERAARVRAIVDYSTWWNATVGITGALVSTDKHFVQFIEGPDSAIDDLVTKLRADTRHSGINVIEICEADRRQFPRWNLAYTGPDTFIDEDLIPILRTATVRSRQITAGKLRSRLTAMAGHS